MSLSVSLVDSLLLFINSPTSPYSDSPSTLYIGFYCDVNWLLVLPQMKARHCLKKIMISDSTVDGITRYSGNLTVATSLQTIYFM
jgi:hypothetical protein